VSQACNDPGCRLCGADVDIELPDALVEDCHAGKLLLFVGAGASTETHSAGISFYDRVCTRLDLQDEPGFPDLMTLFVNRFSRNELIEFFLGHVLYKQGFPTLAARISEFHERIGENPFIRELVTTNWDDFFERCTGAIPLVVGEDFAFWDAPVRKVLKVHGSILNPGSIVATRAEYDRALNDLRSGAVGSAAKHLIATRTVIFVGYSYRDDDIRAIVDALRSDLSTAARKCYFVHPDPNFQPPLDGAEVLATSARHFVKLLDDALVEREYLLPRTIFDRVNRLLGREADARERGSRLEIADHPLEMYDGAFRDGLRDCYGRILARRHTGDDRRHQELQRRGAAYHQLLRGATKNRDYWNAAYIEGYLTGLISIAATDLRIDEVPLYYCPGHGPDTSFARVSAAIRRGALTHKAAYRWAAIRSRGVRRGLVIPHDPYLSAYNS
jgi:SIR2-like domain